MLKGDQGETTQEEAFQSDSGDVDQSSLNKAALRRAFIRHLAYLCSWKKNGRQVTAIALEETMHETTGKTLKEVNYWFASNAPAGNKDKVLNFMRKVLIMLRKWKPDSSPDPELAIFTKSVEFSEDRINYYVESRKEELKNFLSNSAGLGLEEIEIMNEIDRSTGKQMTPDRQLDILVFMTNFLESGTCRLGSWRCGWP